MLFQSTTLRTGSATQGEFVLTQWAEMTSRKVAAVMNATVPVELVNKELQPNDNEIVPSAGEVIETTMAC